MPTPTAHPVPVHDLDPFSEDFLNDPYPWHAQLRDSGELTWLSHYGVWATARHDPVHAALRDPETFCSSAGVGLSDFRSEPPWRPPSFLLEADPPEHTAARALITRALSPGAIRRLRELFRARAEQLVHTLVEKAEFDAVTELAEPFPVTVFSEAVGLPERGRENLLPYGNLAFNAFGPRNRLFVNAMEGSEPVRQWILEHCEYEALAPGGIGRKVYEAGERKGYPRELIPRLVRSLLTAGVDTTVHALGNAILCLARNPGQWQALRDSPELAESAFEESIRFESPVQTFFRTTATEASIGGIPIPAGEKILLFLGAANRDPRRWQDPGRFDVRRRAIGHVGFGSGIHGCVGQMLARLEGSVMLRVLAERVHSWEITGEPVRKLNNTVRGLEHLPVRVRAKNS